MGAPLLTEDLPFKVLRKTWQPVALSRDLKENDLRPFRLLGEDIVLARFPQGLLAAQNSCPHKGMKLDRGCLRDAELRCAYHGWKFDRTGACTNIPSLIQPLPDKQEQARLTVHEVQERYGMVWVDQRNQVVCLAPGSTQIQVLSTEYQGLLKGGDSLFIFALLFANQSQIEMGFGESGGSGGDPGKSFGGFIQTRLPHSLRGLAESFVDRGALRASNLSTAENGVQTYHIRRRTPQATMGTIRPQGLAGGKGIHIDGRPQIL